MTALLALGFGRSAHAATLSVVNTNDSGAGSLRQAIADAAPGDTIDFAAGLSGQTITLTTGELLISKNLTITGLAGGVTISGNNAVRVFEVSGVTVKMSYLTVANGYINAGNGGGIYNSGTLNLTSVTLSGNRTDQIGGGIYNSGTLDLTSVTLSGNDAPNGGGIANYSALNLMNVTISGNSAHSGAGIFNFGTATVTDSIIDRNFNADGAGMFNLGTATLTDSTVSGNIGVDGGGIRNVGPGLLTMTDVAITGNIATVGGGVLNAASGALTMMDVTISGNSTASGLGGGIANYDAPGPLAMTNVTVSGNSATVGGGIYTFNSGTIAMTNVTMSGNSANNGGGGIYSDAAKVNLTNSIVADQTLGADCLTNFGGTIASLGYNLDSDGSCNLTATGDLSNASPMLAPLALNPPGTTQTQALQIGSPAIDHIPPGVNGCGTTISSDQRGVSRPQGSGCDIGAYELIVPPTPTPSPTPIPTPTPSPQPVGGIVALSVSGSGSGSAALPIAFIGGAALAMMMGVWYGRRRWWGL